MVHQLLRALEEGERAAAALTAKLGSRADTARQLAYRLYTLCEWKKWAPEGLAYNGLVQSWPEIACHRPRGRGRVSTRQIFWRGVGHGYHQLRTCWQIPGTAQNGAGSFPGAGAGSPLRQILVTQVTEHWHYDPSWPNEQEQPHLDVAAFYGYCGSSGMRSSAKSSVMPSAALSVSCGKFATRGPSGGLLQ